VSTHALYSPSSFDRVIECPGSLRESTGMPDKSSKFAEEGTRAHEMAASILEGHIVNLLDWHDVENAAEMHDHVLVYTGHVLDLAPEDDDVLLVEQRVQLGANPEVFGTADAIVWSPSKSTLYVRDLKFGAGIAVEVDDNTQMKLYALMALVTSKYPARKVNIGIVQPRCFHAAGPVRTTEFDAIDLLDFWDDVENAIRASKAPDAPLKPGAHCRFCKAAPKCKAVKATAQGVARMVFAPNAAYNGEDLQKTLDWLPVLEAYIKNVREFAYAEAEKGKPIPGYKLVAKNATRRWRDSIDAPELAALLGVPIAELMTEPSIKGVSEIQRLAPGKNDKERAAVLEPFVAKVSSGHTLVHASDKREAIRVDAKAAFSPATT
jgi:hypothetical protein